MTRLTGPALRAALSVDTEERVRAFLPQPGEPVTEGPVLPDPCAFVRYGRREPRE